MSNITDLRISRNFKYTALYVAMNFLETSEGIFEKEFANGSRIVVDSEKGTFQAKIENINCLKFSPKYTDSL